jgi:hypothetical protein
MIDPKEITDALDELRARDARVSPQHTNRASSIGFPCDRRHVLDRTRWQEKPVPDLGLCYIFAEGNRQERAVLQDLQAAGFDIRETQRDLAWPQYQLTAHFDARIADAEGASVLCEIKSMSPYVWQAIETVADMTRSRFPHVRAYPAQLMLYLLLEGKEESGLFVLKNKSTGRIRAIRVDLDYEYAESLIQRCERVNAHVAAGTLPDAINDAPVCDACPWKATEHCCDALARSHGEGADIIDDPELVASLERRAELAEHVKEFDAIDRDVKARFKGRPLTVAAEWIIEGKEQTRTVKATEARTTTAWITTIRRVG